MKSIHCILIANRGEIASRIIRTCKKMGIRTIAVFSTADQYAPFVKEADKAVFIGESSPTQSYLYLDQDNILAVAKAQQADAIHPGYGFLSENAAFAEKCQQAGIIFIGPNPAAIKAMGSKSNAKALMKAHSVPIIPGYQGEDQRIETLVNAAKKIGFPLLLKAAAGGGGKGMRIVYEAAAMEQQILAARREALSAFGDEELIIEKYIDQGRHIEFQIFGDQHGNVIHILERECTIQRRYQKVIEESPSPVVDSLLRERMGAAAVAAASALNYDNAGTVEFILDDHTQEFFFLEVNTRLQVEHPVTEEITGLDLVQLQIEVAEGQVLQVQQSDIHANGYAVEARLYAEDPSRDFVPATGTVQYWEVPDINGLRVESAVESGSEISIHYDPMIAKLIIWDENRANAHRKMAYTLAQLKCMGLQTNQDFLRYLFQQKAILEGQYDTHYLQKHYDPSLLTAYSSFQRHLAVIGISLYNWHLRHQSRTILRAMPSGWRNNPYMPQQVEYLMGESTIACHYTALKDNHFDVQIGEASYSVQLMQVKEPHLQVQVNGIQYPVSIVPNERTFYFHSPETGNLILQEAERFPAKETMQQKGGYEAPMPAQIVKILVKEGQLVKAGDGLIVISSMKMENIIEAQQGGKVEEIYATEGQNVQAGFLLLKLAETEKISD